MDRQRPPGSSSVICGRADGSGPPRLARAVPRTSGPVVAAREEAAALWERCLDRNLSEGHPVTPASVCSTQAEARLSHPPEWMRLHKPGA